MKDTLTLIYLKYATLLSEKIYIMTICISAGVTLELFVIIFAVFSELRRHMDSLAGVYAYSTILILSILSVFIQFFFLFGFHRFFPVVDVSFIVAALFLLYRNRTILGESFKTFKQFYLGNPFFAVFLTVVFVCLFLKAFLLPPTTVDSMTYHLARVLIMQNDGTYFLENFNDYRQDIMPIGYDVLHFLYLRFYTDYGLGFFGFISYTVVIVGTFALTMACFSNVRLSKITCFICASLTMFLVNATSTKNDLILAAITVVCFLAAYRYITTKDYLHLFVLMVALIFGLNCSLFFIYFFYKKTKFKEVIQTVSHDFQPRWFFPLVLPISLVAFLMVLFLHNHIKYGGIMGPDFYYSFLSGSDGVSARTVNLLRYFFQLLDFPVEMGGNVLTQIHDMILGDAKSIGIFPGGPSIQLAGSLFTVDTHAWYGILGLPIILSILWTLLWGKEFLRMLAATILIYAAIVIFTMPWAPWNGRFFAPVFAGGALCFAFMLKKISRKSSAASRYIIICSLLIAGFNLAFQVIYTNIHFMHQLRMQVINRDAYYPVLVTDRIPSGSKVLVISPTNFPIFPLYLRRPDLNITLTGIYHEELYREPLRLNGKEYNLHKLKADDAQEIQKQFDRIFSLGS